MDFECVVVGSGFGGAVLACRASKRWPGKVAVFERGRRYPLGSYPRTPHDMARNFWNVPEEKHPRPHRLSKEEQHGLFDIRNYDHIDVVLGAGLGGGSLIYANVFLEPPEVVFDERWPSSCKKALLAPYYKVAKQVLGARPVPEDGDPRRRITRTELFRQVASAAGRRSELVDVNVFFGNDLSRPLPIGQQERNRYGAVQTSCVYCGECDIGCNTQSKNTLDLNYLFVAESRYGCTIRTECVVERVVPLDAEGRESAAADGTHGFRVHGRDVSGGRRERLSVTAQRVVLSAGTLGTTELLLQAKRHGALPRLSDRLGRSFSGNGDFLSFVLGADRPANPNYGPVITQKIDFNLFESFQRDRAFILEDASYPNLLGWFVEGFKPAGLRIPNFLIVLRNIVGRWFTGTSPGVIGYALAGLLGGDLSYNTAVLLCMGIDRSTGTLSLDEDGAITIDWPWQENLPLYEAILEAGEAFREKTNAGKFLALPTWYRPFRKNVTVHPLGGCVLGETAETGVASADPATFGQVFGYSGLYAADGSIVPTAVGANPTATICALSEKVAEGMTGLPPEVNL